MANDSFGSPPPSPSAGAPAPPPPGASHREWRDWRRQMHDYERSQYGVGGGYGYWPWGWHGVWGWFWPAALILVGLYYLLSNLGLLDWLHGDVIWPILLILLGLLLLVRRGRSW